MMSVGQQLDQRIREQYNYKKLMTIHERTQLAHDVIDWYLECCRYYKTSVWSPSFVSNDRTNCILKRTSPRKCPHNFHYSKMSWSITLVCPELDGATAIYGRGYWRWHIRDTTNKVRSEVKGLLRQLGIPSANKRFSDLETSRSSY